MTSTKNSAPAEVVSRAEGLPETGTKAPILNPTVEVNYEKAFTTKLPESHEPARRAKGANDGSNKQPRQEMRVKRDATSYDWNRQFDSLSAKWDHANHLRKKTT